MGFMDLAEPYEPTGTCSGLNAAEATFDMVKYLKFDVRNSFVCFGSIYTLHVLLYILFKTEMTTIWRITDFKKLLSFFLLSRSTTTNQRLVKLPSSSKSPGVLEPDILTGGALSQTPLDTSMTSPRDSRSLRNTTDSSMSDKLTKLRLQFRTITLALLHQPSTSPKSQIWYKIVKILPWWQRDPLWACGKRRNPTKLICLNRLLYAEGF